MKASKVYKKVFKNRRNVYLLILAVLILLVGSLGLYFYNFIKDKRENVEIDKDHIYIYLEVPVADEIEWWTVNLEEVSEGKYEGYIFLPGTIDKENTMLNFSDEIVFMAYGFLPYRSGETKIKEFNQTVTYKAVMKNYEIYDFDLKICKGSDTIKPMFISIDDEFSIANGFSNFEDMNDPWNHEVSSIGELIYGDEKFYMEIKGRGNANWQVSKKSYNLKLFSDDICTQKEKVKLVNGQEKKTHKYSILANYSDNTLLRNNIALKLADDLGVGLVSDYTDVWLNGDYLGSYLMTPNRDYLVKDAGYLFELDNRFDDEDYSFVIEDLHYDDEYYFYPKGTIKKVGRIIESEDINYEIESFINETWKAISSADGYNEESGKYYLEYIDLESWAKYYLCHEFVKSYDVVCGSIFMHVDDYFRDPKLYAGPLWDMDNAMGHNLNNDTIGLEDQMRAKGVFIQNVSEDIYECWLKKLGNHQDFMDEVRRVYKENSAYFDGLDDYLVNKQEEISDSAYMNFLRWNLDQHDQIPYNDFNLEQDVIYDQGTEYEEIYVKTQTRQDYIDNLRTYIRTRAKYFHEEFE